METLSENERNKRATRTTVVRQHPRRVPVSKKNPTGITIVDRHPRRLPGTYLDAEQIKETFKKYNRKNITYPTPEKLQKEYEAKEFTFKDIRQKDLKDPAISIPMGIRWLFRKRATAKSKLKRTPTDTELILEYKGLLKSKTDWKRSALENYQKHYKTLKGK